MLDWMYLVRSDGPVVPGPPSSCPYSPECVEEEFSEDEMRRPTPIRSTLWVCKRTTGS
jgi:hypothetical protein